MRVKSKIRNRLLLYFAMALILFSIVIGSVFLVAFREYSVSVHKGRLGEYANTLARALSGDATATPGGGADRYGAYLRFASEVADADVWIVDENLSFLTVNRGQGQMRGNYNYSELPENADELIQEVMSGKTAYSEGFSDVLSELTITVGAPIIDENGVVRGAVLLHSPVDGVMAGVNRGAMLLIGSISLALLVAIAFSFLLSDRFIKPLAKMKTAAIQLSDGHYSTRCEVSQDDEFGELAKAIDVLANRLELAGQEREKLEQLRQDFVANISHELKTPVTVLRGSLEALCDKVVTDPQKVEAYHAQMLGETKFLQRLVEDLLDLSRLQNLDFAMEQKPVRICEVIEDAVRAASRIASQKNIRLNLNIQSDCKEIIGDYARLRQMFMVVLHNAVKFSPVDSAIDVIVNDQDVAIRDYGPGISPDDLPHIFERFYKNRDERNKEGSGLGLSIANQIASRHHVRLSASNSESGGAEFRFHFMSAAHG